MLHQSTTTTALTGGTATLSFRLRARAATRLVTTAVGQRASRSARQERRRRDAFYRGIWLVAAANLRLDAHAVGGSAVEIELGGEVLRVSRGATSLETADAFDRAGDKPLIHRLLAEAGIAVPDHRLTTLRTLADVEPFVTASSGCVVKPALDGSGGRGVTTQVRTRHELRRAAVAAAAAAGRASRSSGRTSRNVAGRLAAKLSELGDLPLLVEEQVPGDNYRLLFLDGLLVDAVKRARPVVIGDGTSTIARLIARTNEARHSSPVERGGAAITIDADLRATLSEQALALSSVPALGRRIVLKTAINEGAIADHEPATDLLCRSIVDSAATAATIAGTRLVGVDVITTDPTVPLARSGGCVLEINTTPGLAYHYHQRPGQIHVARVILERLTR
jgi:cyanophycin synthetase